MMKVFALVALACTAQAQLFGMSAQRVNMMQFEEKLEARKTPLLVQANTPFSFNEFPDQWFTQPLDHFDNSSHVWDQRYWVNTRHYVPGSKGPVIVLDGGETSGKNRIPFLDYGTR